MLFSVDRIIASVSQYMTLRMGDQALKLADRGYVLENGHVVLSDTPQVWKSCRNCL